MFVSRKGSRRVVHIAWPGEARRLVCTMESIDRALVLLDVEVPPGRRVCAKCSARAERMADRLVRQARAVAQ